MYLRELAAAFSLILFLATAQACAAPLGSPTAALGNQQNLPQSEFLAPTGYGNLTGADGDVSSPIWAATTEQGFLHYFNGSNSTPTKTIDTGISGLTGVAYLGTDKWALSATKTIYEGSVTGTTWHTDKTILVLGLTSDLTDLDWTPTIGYEVATQFGGIKSVAGDGSSVDVYTPSWGWTSVDLIEFKPNTYDNPLLQIAQNGNGFINVDASGKPFGYGIGHNLNNGVDIEGIAYYQGGFAVAQAPGVQIHGDLMNADGTDMQQYMASVPEPATLSLLALGGLLPLCRRRK